MSCEGMQTGTTDHEWTVLPPFKLNWVCVDLRDPATVYEVKKAIYVLGGVSTRMDSAIWTVEDEGALRLLASEAWARDYAMSRTGPAGWEVPSGEGIEQMCLRLNWATRDARMSAEFPWLFYAMDVLGDAPGLLDGLKTTDPAIGAPARPPIESAPEPIETPAPIVEEPSEPTEPALPTRPTPSYPSVPPAEVVETGASSNLKPYGIALAAAGLVVAGVYYFAGK
jgi:hypothetical protein